MILPGSFNRDWIEQFRQVKEFSKINPPVLEKMIQALALLETLKLAGMDFIFKGGSSLILLLEKTRRFSVDIDIITTHSRKELEPIFDRVIEMSHFENYRLDEDRSYKEGVPKAHYEFSYQSVYNPAVNYILLDILFEQPSYPEVIEVPIEALWLNSNKESVLVKVPSIESITGDKLTAFAPNTTGILYGKGKSLEIIKQLFDLGELFNAIKHFETVSASFSILAKKEIEYRNLKINREAILDDIIETGFLIAQREKNHSEPGKSHFKELRDGIAQFKSFLASGFFRIDEAIEAAAKAAYIAAKIKVGNNEAPKHYDKGKNINDYWIQNREYNYLNKLKKLPNGALFYWYHALNLV